MSDSEEYDFHASDNSDEAMREFYSMFPITNRDSETLLHRTFNENNLSSLSNVRGQAADQSRIQSSLATYSTVSPPAEQVAPAPELRSLPQINIQEKEHEKDKQALFVVRSNPVLTQQQSASNEVQEFIEPKLVSRFAQNEQSQLVESLNYAGVIQAKHRMIIGRMSDLLQENAQLSPTDSLKLQELRIQREAVLKEASESLRSTLIDIELSFIIEYVASGSLGSSRNLGQSRSDVITPNVESVSTPNPPEMDVDMLKARGFYPPPLDPSSENGIVRLTEWYNSATDKMRTDLNTEPQKYIMKARETNYEQRSKMNQARTSEPFPSQPFEPRSGNRAKRSNCSKRKISKIQQTPQRPSRPCKLARRDINDTGNARNDNFNTSKSAINQVNSQIEQAEQAPLHIEQTSLERLQSLTRIIDSSAEGQVAVYNSRINGSAERSVPFDRQFKTIRNRNRPRGASKTCSEFDTNIANDQKQSLPNKSSQLSRNLGKDASQDERSDAPYFESIFTQDICDSADRGFEMIREFLEE